MINVRRLNYFFQGVIFFLVSLLLILLLTVHAVGQEVTVRSIVGKNRVYVGESFLFQIQVEGDDNPTVPDVSVIQGFKVEDRGGQKNSSSQVTIINGRMIENVTRKYIFSYLLTPLKAGQLTIPSISVFVQGETLRTSPVRIQVLKPVETAEFKLRMKFSSAEVYQGEPITLSVIWYITKDVVDYSFTLPFLSDPRFHVADLPQDITRQPGRRSGMYVQIPVGGKELTAKKGRGRLGGRDFTTLTFEQVLIPLQSGSLTLPAATVACKAISGYKKRSSRSPFGDFFEDDFFGDSFFLGGRRKAIYNKYVIPSNEPVLRVKELPAEGRPPNFNGLVGEYSLIASAAPTQVNVGDPITLNIQVAGPEYLGNVELPPLDRQENLSRNFKIPSEMSKGKIERGVKTFTQTVRARNSQVKSIPPVELPYFNSEKGRYEVARSEPITIEVAQSRIVTAKDAEGRNVLETGSKKLETWTSGIAHNYEDPSVLDSQKFDPLRRMGARSWLWLLMGPPLIYLMLFIVVQLIKKYLSDPEALLARWAGSEALKTLKELQSRTDQSGMYLEVLETIKEYLGQKLRIPAGAITFKDVSKLLKARKIEAQVVESLKNLFDQCEAGRYSGGAASADSAGLLQQAITVVEQLERGLK